MEAAVEGWHSLADPLAAEVVGSSKVFIENDEACSAGQCNGGTMMADAIFDYFSDMEVPGAWSKINAAVVNAAISRTSFDERVSLGELTLADMYEMYPYEDEYFLVTMRGEKVYAMMEHSVHFEEHIAEKFLQVSGIRVVYNRQAPPGRRVRGLLILCTSCRAPKYERVVRLQWYTIAMPEFMVNGGNGYDFRDVPRGHKEKTGVTDDIVMKTYIRKKTPLFPAIDDRIIFMDAAAWPCPDAVLATALVVLLVSRRKASPS